MLLVTRDSIPSPVAAELERLDTFEIIVLGGTDSISDSTFAAIAAYAPSATRVTRIEGPDRFAVSAAVSRNSWRNRTGAETVYVASGLVFPDALSGSAAAILTYSPVLLVTGHEIPDVVGAELERLKPSRIVVLGGEDTVADSLVIKLSDYLR